MNATEILSKAAGHMRDRAATYDKPEGERSMAQTMAIFNLFHGTDLTEAQGWHLLQILKDVRLFARPGYHADSAEDCVAYAALKAEALSAADIDRGYAEMLDKSSAAHQALKGAAESFLAELQQVADWPDESRRQDAEDVTIWPTEDRIDVIGSNGPTGEHYDDEWKDAPKWASWKAQDSNKAWHWFELMPKAAQGFWACTGGMMKSIEGGERGYNADWRLTLQKRPI